MLSPPGGISKSPGNRISTRLGSTAIEAELLTAPHRGRGHLLVDRRLEADLVALDKAPRTQEPLIEPAQGRPAIPGDETAGIETGGGITPPLHDRQADQRLRTGQINPAF